MRRRRRNSQNAQVQVLLVICFILSTMVGILGASLYRDRLASKFQKANKRNEIVVIDDKRILVKKQRPVVVVDAATKIVNKPVAKPFVSSYVQKRYIPEEPATRFSSDGKSLANGR